MTSESGSGWVSNQDAACCYDASGAVRSGSSNCCPSLTVTSPSCSEEAVTGFDVADTIWGEVWGYVWGGSVDVWGSKMSVVAHGCSEEAVTGFGVADTKFGVSVWGKCGEAWKCGVRRETW